MPRFARRTLRTSPTMASGRWRQLRVFLAVLVKETTVHTIAMRGDKVHRGPAFRHVIKEFRHPGGASR